MYVRTLDLLHQAALLTVLHHMQSAVQAGLISVAILKYITKHTFVKVLIRL